jgi:phosphoglycerol transferase MdoB-like AlkP superfamily enzyme
MASVVGISFLLFVMAVLRLAFVALNWGTFIRFGAPDIALSFINGARFDLHVIIVLGGLFFLLVHVPGAWKTKTSLARKILLIPIFLFIPLLALCILNMHYYADAGRHLSYEITAVGNDRYDLIASLKMLASYKLSILIFLITSVTLVRNWMKVMKRVFRSSRKVTVRSEWVWLFLFLFLMALGLRGTITGRPLRMHHAFIQGSTELGHLTLNPIYTVKVSLLGEEIEVPIRFSEDEALQNVRKLLDTAGTDWHGDEAPLYRRNPYSVQRPAIPYNVVILVLESWSPRYLGSYGSTLGLTPEFDKLAEAGALFDNFYAAGSRTEEGLAALCLGIPAFNHARSPGKGAFLAGSLEQNRYQGIGHLLAEHGYSSVYLHGESSGNFRQASIARLAGFRKHLGSEELELTPDETTGPWGGWDHVLLEKLADIVRSESEPFLALWISLTNHSPYNLPDDTFQTASPTDTEGKYMDTVRYTDYHLGRFFDTVSKMELFSRTIFVITADHSARTIDSMKGRFNIPLLIYAPGIVLPRVDSRVGSQVDIIPTLLQLLGLESYHHAMGNSLFDDGVKRFAFLNFSQGYGWVSGHTLLEIGPGGDIVNLRDLRTGAMISEIPEPYLVNGLSFLQVGRQLLIENRFVPVP